MTKHQRVLLSGPSHCLWCGVVLGLLAADMYPGDVPAFSGAVLRGLAVASFISVLLWMMVSYLEDISWTYIWGGDVPASAGRITPLSCGLAGLQLYFLEMGLRFCSLHPGGGSASCFPCVGSM